MRPFIKQHRRQLFIGAIATAMVLLIAFGLSRGDSAVFEFLARHPSAETIVRRVFKFTGTPNGFEKRLLMSKLICAEDGTGIIEVGESSPLSELR